MIKSSPALRGVFKLLSVCLGIIGCWWFFPAIFADEPDLELGTMMSGAVLLFVAAFFGELSEKGSSFTFLDGIYDWRDSNEAKES